MIIRDANNMCSPVGMMLDMNNMLMEDLLVKGKIDERLVARAKSFMKEMEPDLMFAMDNAYSKFMQSELNEAMAELNAITNGFYDMGASALAENATDVIRTVSEDNLNIVRQFTADKVRTVASDYLSSLERTIGVGYLGKSSMKDVCRRLQSSFSLHAYQAKRIAMTESGKLQNMAARNVISDVSKRAAEQGIMMSKYWIHASGIHPDLPPAMKARRAARAKTGKYNQRGNHFAMHGKTAEAPDGLFELRGQDGVLYTVSGPHDPTLPAGEVINCRCKLSARIDRERSKITIGKDTSLTSITEE